MHEVVRRKVKCALIDAWRVLASTLSTVVGCCTTGSPEEVGAVLGGMESVCGSETEVVKVLSGPGEVGSF